MKKGGFLLIEALIYISISGFLFLLIFQFTAAVYSKYKQIAYFNSYNSSANCAIELIIRDIQKASNDFSKWKKIEESCFVFEISSEQRDIGWMLEQNNLIKVEGEFDRLNQRWKKGVKSLVLSNIKYFKFFINQPLYLKNNDSPANICLVSIILEIDNKNKKVQLKKSTSPRLGMISI